jgi:hypothetical protein
MYLMARVSVGFSTKLQDVMVGWRSSVYFHDDVKDVPDVNQVT